MTAMLSSAPHVLNPWRSEATGDFAAGTIKNVGSDMLCVLQILKVLARSMLPARAIGVDGLCERLGQFDARLSRRSGGVDHDECQQKKQHHGSPERQEYFEEQASHFAVFAPG